MHFMWSGRFCNSVGQTQCIMGGCLKIRATLLSKSLVPFILIISCYIKHIIIPFSKYILPSSHVRFLKTDKLLPWIYDFIDRILYFESAKMIYQSSRNHFYFLWVMKLVHRVPYLSLHFDKTISDWCSWINCTKLK